MTTATSTWRREETSAWRAETTVTATKQFQSNRLSRQACDQRRREERTATPKPPLKGLLRQQLQETTPPERQSHPSQIAASITEMTEAMNSVSWCSWTLSPDTTQKKMGGVGRKSSTGRSPMPTTTLTPVGRNLTTWKRSRVRWRWRWGMRRPCVKHTRSLGASHSKSWEYPFTLLR